VGSVFFGGLILFARSNAGRTRLHDLEFNGILRAVTIHPMQPSLIPAHHHAPEVTPDDVWDDPDGWDRAAQTSVTVLPPIKTKTESTSLAPTGNDVEGLRIGAERPRRQAEDGASQLEVQEITGNVVRLAPEVSAIPKVPRQIRIQEGAPTNSLKRPPQGEGKEWGRARNQSVRWIFGTSLAVAAVVIVALMLLPLVNRTNAARPRPGQDGLVLAQDEKIEGLASLNDLLPRQLEAEEIFRNYASASVVDDVLPWMRDAGAVEPLIRASHPCALVSKEWLPPEDTSWNVFDNDGHPFGLLAGNLPNFSKFSAYLVLSQNQLQLDWKATTGYGTATFEDLERNQGDPTEIRAKILPSGFFTATFPEVEFQSYQLVAPDDGKAIWCYARRGDTAERILDKLFMVGEILQSTAEPKKVTVRLEPGPAGALPNQWLITEMLHKDWVTP
jgi:hypothetical protein